MESNKDEALQAKAISEAKLAQKDYLGAKKFAQKAEKLCSGIEGLSHLLIILDVYISSEKKINGESDWYSVLGVQPTADDDTIRKSYWKLILSLHPDKNKSVGAEGAFKLVSQAHALLSDKTKRKVYDQKRNPRSIYQPVIVTQKTTTSTTKPTQPNHWPLNTSTFRTSCPKCLMQLEYSKVYLHKKIHCPMDKCRWPFLALELSHTHTNHHPTMRYSQKQNHNGSHHMNIQQESSINFSGVNRMNVQKGLSENTSSVDNSGPFKSHCEAKVGAMRYQNSISGLGVKADGIAKKRHVTEQSSMVNACHKYAKVNSGGEKVNVSPTTSKLNNNLRELSLGEVYAMLTTKARDEIFKKMDEWNVEKASKNEGTMKEDEISNSDKTKKYAEKATVNGSKVTDVTLPVKDTMVSDDVDSDATDPGAILMSDVLKTGSRILSNNVDKEVIPHTKHQISDPYDLNEDSTTSGGMVEDVGQDGIDSPPKIPGPVTDQVGVPSSTIIPDATTVMPDTLASKDDYVDGGSNSDQVRNNTEKGILEKTESATALSHASVENLNTTGNSFVKVMSTTAAQPKVNFRTLESDLGSGEDDVVIPLASVKEVNDRLQNSLYGYFIGKRVAFLDVENYARISWGKYGFQRIMMNSMGFFLFKFSTMKGAEDVLENGPWMIQGIPVILNKWSPSVSLTKEDLSKVPVWVKLHDVPMAAFTQDGLSMIATKIGTPMMLDSYTSTMCLESWGNSSYARAMIEVTADREMKETLAVLIPKLDGTGYTRETVRVEYEWKPPRCDHCKIFGHANVQCSKACTPSSSRV